MIFWNIVKSLSPQSKSAKNSMSTSRTETADKPNDSQDSSCEQLQSMVKVGNSNSSGMTSAEEIPNAAMKAQLENAKKLMLQFQTFYYDGTAGTHIPPFLEHWIFSPYSSYLSLITCQNSLKSYVSMAKIFQF